MVTKLPQQLQTQARGSTLHEGQEAPLPERRGVQSRHLQTRADLEPANAVGRGHHWKGWATLASFPVGQEWWPVLVAVQCVTPCQPCGLRTPCGGPGLVARVPQLLHAGQAGLFPGKVRLAIEALEDEHRCSS